MQYIVYISVKGGSRFEVARESGAPMLTSSENAKNIATAHAANYRSSVTVSVTRVEYGESIIEVKGTKGW